MPVEFSADSSQFERAISRIEKGFADMVARSEQLTRALGLQHLETQKLEKDYSSLSLEFNRLKASQDQLKGQVATISAEYNSLSKELVATSAALKTLESAQRSASRAAKDKSIVNSTLVESEKSLHSAFRGTAGALNTLWLSYGQIIPIISAYVAATSAIKIFKAGSEFEYLNTFSSALNDGAVAVATINEQLLNLKGVGQTPNELAKGFLELQKAGMSASESMKQLPIVSKYATVAEIDLGKATEQLVTITNAFSQTSKGASGGMLTLADTADIVAYAAQKSVASFDDMQVAFKHMIATASTAKFSIQEVAAALMIMAQKGLTRELGATGLRTAFERLITPTEKASKLFLEAGGNLKAIYSQGQFKGIQSIGEELRRLKDSINPKDWAEFAFAAFGLRGIRINAFIDSIADMKTNLDGLRDSAGMVERVFAQLSGTTKINLKELEASFQRAFIKAFEGEKATQVLDELNRLVSGPGFASSLNDIAAGAFNLAKGLTWVVDQFFRLPTGVAETGVIAAVLFGKSGKAVLAGMVVMADAINNISWALENNISIVTKSSKELADYRKNFEENGKAAAEWQDKIADTKQKLANLNDRAASSSENSFDTRDYSQAINKLNDQLKYEEDQLANVLSVKKSYTTATYAQGQADVYASKEAAKANQIAINSFEQLSSAQNKSADRPSVFTDDKAEKEARKKEESIIKIKSLTESLNTYIENADNKTLANKLSSLEKEYAANEAVIRNSKALDEQKYAASEANLKVYEMKKQGIMEEAAGKAEQLENTLHAQLESSGEASYDRRMVAIKSHYDKQDALITATARSEEEANAWRLLNVKGYYKAVDDLDAQQAEKQKKKAAAEKEFYRDLAKMANDAGLGGISEYDQRVKEIDLTLEGHINKLLKEFPEGSKEYKKAAAYVAELRERLIEADTALAKLSNNPLRGFSAAIRDIGKDLKTLGQIGYEFGQDLHKALSESFKNIISSDWQNPFLDRMSSITDKISDMQYGALKSSTEQLDFLRKKYETSLQGAMSGNEQAFNQYMSNIDAYLEKAKETMSPEEYERTYAQTMADLDRLNKKYASETEDVWSGLSDAWDKLQDNMLTSLTDMLAQALLEFVAWIAKMVAAWAVSELAGIFGWSTGAGSVVGGIVGALTGSSGGSGGSGGGGIAGAIAQSVVSAAAKKYVLTPAYNAVSGYFGGGASAGVGVGAGTGAGTAVAGYGSTMAGAGQGYGVIAAQPAYQTGAYGTTYGTTTLGGSTAGSTTTGTAAATTSTTSTSAGTGIAASTQLGVGAALMAALTAFGLYQLGRQVPTRNSFGHTQPNQLGPIGLSDSMTGISREQIDIAAELGMRIKEFSYASLDAANGVMVATDALVGPNGFIEGTKFGLYTWDQATQTWFKGVKGSQHIWDEMMLKMEKMKPASQEAVLANAQYIASLNGLPSVAEELALAFDTAQGRIGSFVTSFVDESGRFVSAEAEFARQQAEAVNYVGTALEGVSENVRIEMEMNQSIQGLYESGAYVIAGYTGSLEYLEAQQAALTPQTYALAGAEGALTSAVNSQVKVFDKATGAWVKQTDLFSSMVDEMRSVSPPTSAAIASTAKYIAEMHGVPGMTDLLIQAFSALGGNLMDFHTQIVGVANGVASAAAAAVGYASSAQQAAAGITYRAARDSGGSPTNYNPNGGGYSTYDGAKASGAYIPPNHYAMVGEAGPEFVTGPAQVISTSNTSKMIRDNKMSDDEVAAMLWSIASNTRKTAKVLEKFEYIGIKQDTGDNAR